MASFTVRSRISDDDVWHCLDKHLSYLDFKADPVPMTEQEARKVYAECEDHAQLMVQKADGWHVVEEK